MTAALQTSETQRLAIDDFVEEARQVSVAEAADRLGVAGLSRAGTSGEESGPCPACGGTDRFAINRKRNVWNCRGAIGGKDGISLAAHLGGLDIASRDGFLLACAEALGRPLPDEIATETEADKAAREARLAARKAKTAADRDRGERAAADFREKERAKARGKWVAGFPLTGLPAISPQRGETDARTAVRAYLALRLGGHALPDLPHLRAIAAEPYWVTVGKGEQIAFARGEIDAATVWQEVPADGRPHAIHEGLALVAPFVDPVGTIVGCHLTFIDLAGPKGRPLIWLRTTKADGTRTIERAKTKKMRGTKKGGMIPLVGFTESGGRICAEICRTRGVLGEGIENVLAVGLAEGFRPDTLYAAAGDLGNLAGPADPKSAFGHPVLKDRGGKRPLRVQGPVPRTDQAPDDAMAVPDRVSEILLAADGDSERWTTAAAMLRAERRLSAPPLSSSPSAASLAGAPGSPSASAAKLKDGAKNRAIATAWPPAGMDFADLLTGETL